MENHEELDELCKRIDRIDDRLLDVLSQRARLILRIADSKIMTSSLRAMNPGPLDDEALERICQTINEEMGKLVNQNDQWNAV